MTAAQWDEAMAPTKTHREAYAYAEVKVREALVALPAGLKYNTAALVDLLYPGGDNEDTAQRIFRALKTLAMSSLADCWEHGPAVQRYGRTVRPKLWHAPAIKSCPHCGGVL